MRPMHRPVFMISVGIAVPLLVLGPTLVVLWGLSRFLDSYWVPLIFPVGLSLVIWMTPRNRLDVVFDGHCGFCKRTVGVLRGLDWARRLCFLSFRDWERVHARHPQLDFDECERDLHVVERDAKYAAGINAYHAISWRVPLLWPVALALHLEPIRRVAERTYRSFADSRSQKACGDSSCTLHPPRDV